MSRAGIALGLAVALCGCAAGARRPASTDGTTQLLGRADQQMAASQYRSAAGLYDEFLRTHPGDPEVARVRATRHLLERLFASQADAERLQREVERLKADLERLRSIDLRRTPGSP